MYVSRSGSYTSGVFPEVEDLFPRQAREMDVPTYGLAFIWGVSPCVEEPGINLIRSYAYSAPYEDLKLKRP